MSNGGHHQCVPDQVTSGRQRLPRNISPSLMQNARDSKFVGGAKIGIK